MIYGEKKAIHTIHRSTFLQVYLTTNHYGGVSYRAYFFMPRNVKIFWYLVGDLNQHSQEYYIPRKGKQPKIFSSPSSGIQHFREKRMCAMIKISKYPYHHPKPLAIDHRLPPSITATSHRLLSPPARHRPPSTNHQQPPSSRVFFKIYQIFPRIKFAHQKRLKYHIRKSYSPK